MTVVLKDLKPLQAEIPFLKTWLETSALPLWLESGCRLSDGIFYERIGQDGAPMSGDNRRSRVPPRQIYCLTAGGARGLGGPWREAARAGMEAFDRIYLRSDGLYGALSNAEGALIDPSFDLYNQAFALFSFAQYANSFPAEADAFETKAVELLDRLEATYKHPIAGFEEDNPVKLPLCSNPHMHLFEAALAWEVQAKDKTRWSTLADEIAHMAMDRFIDPVSGGLREFFDQDWKPHPSEKGRIMEPGHQFEWAWLLDRWGDLRKSSKANSKAQRLFEIGLRHGMSPDGKVAIMSLYDDFSVHDPIARMWPQTEWLKAATKLALVTDGKARIQYIDAAVHAARAFRLFLETPIKGLWYDKRRPDGTFIDEPAPASTFYHILCAVYEAEDNLNALKAV